MLLSFLCFIAGCVITMLMLAMCKTAKTDDVSIKKVYPQNYWI